MTNFNKILNYIFLVLGLILYLFSVLTSSWHIFHVYQLFEKENEHFVALFITIALEISIIFITYVFYYTRNLYKFKVYNRILYAIIIILIIYLWFLNYIYMEKNWKETIIILKSYDISFIIPLIASFFLPFSSLSLSLSIIIILNRLGIMVHSTRKNINQQQEVLTSPPDDKKK